jgi:hypothetical protein
MQFPVGGTAVKPVFAGKADDIAGRPRLMLPLYSTLAALQGADAYLTARGLAAGVHEHNPLMRRGNGIMTVTKMVTTATTIVIAEKMWKRNRAAAIATMVAANAVTAAVVARNARIVSAVR